MPQPPLGKTSLFKSITIGNNVKLSHRLVLPPLTRCRADKEFIPTDIQAAYYEARSKTPGSLLITEATFAAPNAAANPQVPGIWNERQFKAWKQIVDRVHANGSYMSSQLWHMGRQGDPGFLAKQNVPFEGASDDVYMSEASRKAALKANNPLKGLTKQQIKDYVKHYGNVAQKAVNISGFDLVEIHAANGYLFDQFFQSISNTRTDEYGGTIENRARFFFQVLDQVISEIGGSRVACRLSPWSKFGTMAGVDGDPHPYATFGYIVSELEKRRKEHGFGYLSLVEPLVVGDTVKLTKKETTQAVGPNNDWVSLVFKGPIIRSGGYYNQEDSDNVDRIKRDVSLNDRTLIGIGRPLTANPDFVERFRKGLPLTPFNRKTFYIHSNYGYNTYGNYGEGINADEAETKHLGKPLA